MTDRYDKIDDDLMFAADPNEFSAGFTFPSLYATMMTRYIYEHGSNDDRCLDALAMVSCKNHHHAMGNAYAQFHREFKVDDVKNSALVADPLRRLHYSPITDGAAALILTNPEIARKLTDTPIYIVSSQQATTDISLYTRDSFTSMITTKLAMESALNETGLKIDDIQIAEVHDYCTIEEIMFLEDSGFYDKGEGYKGVYDSYQSFKGGEAEGNQVDADSSLNVALCHNVGGTGGIANVHILMRKVK
jgi:acetyl-CoA C-acetyltransferase